MRKKLLKRIKRKPLKGKKRNRIDFVDNNVEEYWGSSTELLKDIEKYGIEHFTKEVLETCNSKWHMTYAELSWQIKCNVILNKRFYNGILNVRIGKSPKNYVDIERCVDTLNL